MRNNARWKGKGFNTTSRGDGKYARIREIAKSFLKKFGPLILTAVAAAIEHRWLEHSDESASDNETKAEGVTDELVDKSSLRELRHEVRNLKRSLNGRTKDSEGAGESSSSPHISASRPFRDRRPPLRRDQPLEEYFKGPPFEGERTGSRSRHSRPYVDQQSLHDNMVPRGRRRHRHSSVPNRSPYDEELSVEAVHAGKVAALAGMIEAVHVGDLRGEWLGPKGVRVGTTMASSFGASYSRDRDPATFRRRDVIADVGTGLLISRLVHGSSRRIGEDYRRRRRRRRWSYCY